MSVRSASVDLSRRGVRAVVTSPVRPQTYLNLAYLLLAFPLGIAYFVLLIVGTSVGFSLTFLLVGVPILLTLVLAVHALAGFERLTARYLLGVEVPSPGYPFLEREGVRERTKALVASRETATAFAYLFSKFVIGIVAFTLVTTLLSCAAAFLLAPLYYSRGTVRVGIVGDPVEIAPSLYVPWGDLLVGAEFAVRITNWEITTLPEALAMSAVGLVLLVLSFGLLNAFARAIGWYTKVVLGDWDEIATPVSPRESR